MTDQPTLKEFCCLSDCRKLRDAGFEQRWQNMMDNRREIPLEDILEKCELKHLLEVENEEDVPGALWEFVAADSGSGAYVSQWGQLKCVFLQAHGFEFIFVSRRIPGGRMWSCEKIKNLALNH